MTEFKFPDPQPIDWDALDDGDRVLIEAVVRTYCSKHNYREKRLQRSTDVGAYLFATEGSLISGHAIKAPKPIAVGDRVSIVGRVPGHWVVLALDDDVAWLRHTENPTRFRHECIKLAHLVRVKP